MGVGKEPVFFAEQGTKEPFIVMQIGYKNYENKIHAPDHNAQLGQLCIIQKNK